MPIYKFVCVDPKGVSAQGTGPAASVENLKAQLQARQFTLVSCEEIVDRRSSEPVPLAPVPQPPAKAPQAPEDERKKDDWPVKTPSQYMVMGVVFIGCVVIGYLVGR